MRRYLAPAVELSSLLQQVLQSCRRAMKLEVGVATNASDFACCLKLVEDTNRCKPDVVEQTARAHPGRIPDTAHSLVACLGWAAPLLPVVVVQEMADQDEMRRTELAGNRADGDTAAGRRKRPKGSVRKGS